MPDSKNASLLTNDMNEPEQPRRLPIDFKDWCADPLAKPINPHPEIREDVASVIRKILAENEIDIAVAKIVALVQSQPRTLAEIRGEDK